MHRHVLSLLVLGSAMPILAAQAPAQTNAASRPSEKAMLIEKDYEALTGRWQARRPAADRFHKHVRQRSHSSILALHQ